VVERTTGNGGRTLVRVVNRTPLAYSDLVDVGPGGGGVIAADGQVVAEAAVRDTQGGVIYIGAVCDGAASAKVYNGKLLAGTAVAVAAADGLIVVELAARDRSGATVGNGSSEGLAGECPGHAIARDSGVAAEGTAGDGEGGGDDGASPTVPGG
jgi:hypothetical protein